MIAMVAGHGGWAFISSPGFPSPYYTPTDFYLFLPSMEIFFTSILTCVYTYTWSTHIHACMYKPAHISTCMWLHSYGYMQVILLAVRVWALPSAGLWLAAAMILYQSRVLERRLGSAKFAVCACILHIILMHWIKPSYGPICSCGSPTSNQISQCHSTFATSLCKE